MRILLTRAEADAQEMRVNLAKHGVEADIAPLISATLETIPASAVAGVDALIATSRNGLKALRVSPAFAAAKSLPLFAVGPATSALARDMGFLTIVEGPGTAAALAAVIKNQFAPSKAKAGGQALAAVLLHLAGDKTAFDLRPVLADTAIELRSVPAYRVVEAFGLPEHVVSGLSQDQFGAVVLMSPRTAAVWVRLISAAGLADRVARLKHVCLSNAVSEPLAPLGQLDIAVVSRPNGQEILSYICKLAKGATTR